MQPVFYQGLKRRPTFNEIVGYLDTEQQMLKYPDRTAMRIKNDPYYTNLDGQGGMSLGDQAQRLQQEQMRQQTMRQELQGQGISPQQGMAQAVGSDEFYDAQEEPERPRFLPPSDSVYGSPAGQATPQRPEFLRRAASSGGFSNRDAQYHRIHTPPSHISVHSSPSGYATPYGVAPPGYATPHANAPQGIDPAHLADLLVAYEEEQRQEQARHARQIAEQASQAAQPSMVESFLQRPLPTPPPPPLSAVPVQQRPSAIPYMHVPKAPPPPPVTQPVEPQPVTQPVEPPQPRSPENVRTGTPSHVSVNSSQSGRTTPQYVASSGRATPHAPTPTRGASSSSAAAPAAASVSAAAAAASRSYEEELSAKYTAQKETYERLIKTETGLTNLITMYQTKFNKPLVPGKYDKDADGNLNDTYKNKLIDKLLALEFGSLHKTLDRTKPKPPTVLDRQLEQSELVGKNISKNKGKKK